MIFGIIANLSGSVWRIKVLCQSVKSPRIKSIYVPYKYENNSPVAWNLKFCDKPCFPRGKKSIFSSCGASIGRHCVVFQQEKNGSNTLSDSKGAGTAITSNNYHIGARVNIVSDVRIGDDVRAGANAVVFSDSPDNTVVMVGGQKQFVKNKPQNNRIYSHHKVWVLFDDGKWVPVTDAIVLCKHLGLSGS